VEEQSVWELLLIDRGNSAAVDERRQLKNEGSAAWRSPGAAQWASAYFLMLKYAVTDAIVGSLIVILKSPADRVFVARL